MSDCSSYRRRCGWIASRREQRSSPTNPQPTLSSKHPEPASVYTNQASAKSNKSHMPATGGCRHLLHVRSWSRAHLHSRAHIHGYAHTHGASQPDETSVRLAQIKRQSNSLKCPAAASHLRGSTRPTGLLKTPGGHGYGIAWRCGGVNVVCVVGGLASGVGLWGRVGMRGPVGIGLWNRVGMRGGRRRRLDWFVGVYWRGYLWKPAAGLVEFKVNAVYGWCINSK